MLLGSHDGQPACVVVQMEDRPVGQSVQLHDLFTLDVRVAGASQDLGEAGAGCIAGDDLAGQRQVVEETGQCPLGFGVAALLFQDVAFNGRDLAGKR